jgi:hypothetical protein
MPCHNTWVAVARLLGVSTDTLQRARHAAGESVDPTCRPFFASDEEVVAWFRSLRERARRPRTAPRPPSIRCPAREQQRAIDPRQLVRDLVSEDEQR